MAATPDASGSGASPDSSSVGLSELIDSLEDAFFALHDLKYDWHEIETAARGALAVCDDSSEGGCVSSLLQAFPQRHKEDIDFTIKMQPAAVQELLHGMRVAEADGCVLDYMGVAVPRLFPGVDALIQDGQPIGLQQPPASVTAMPAATVA